MNNKKPKLHIVGSNNIVGNNNKIIKTDKIIHKPPKIEIIYDENVHISSEQRYQIQERVKEIAILMQSGGEQKPYPKIYGALKRRFKVATYAEIKKEDFGEAMHVLQRMHTKARNDTFKQKPSVYKASTIKNIYTRWNKIAKKEEIYDFVEKKLGKRVDSLKKLSAEDISTLEKRVYYVYNKYIKNK